MEERQTSPPILPLPLEELIPLLQAWLQARLPEPERKPGWPRTFLDLSLFLFHLVRALLGHSSERLRRELARNPRLRRHLGLGHIPSATLIERSRDLPWLLLRGGKRVGQGRRRLVVLGQGRSPYLAAPCLPTKEVEREPGRLDKGRPQGVR